MKFLLSFLILMLPLACSTNSERAESLDDVYSEDMEVPISLDAGIIGNQRNEQQKLIKESYLNFETQDIEKTYKDISQIVSSLSGFIQDDTSNKGYNQISRRITIRIPTDNFQQAIDAISSKVEYFDTKRISSKDVTEEFIDLEARLKAKQTLEARYLELLNKANNVKEILEIERELSSIREEIEAKQGRLKYLQDKVSQSTINVEFYKLTSETVVTRSYGSKMWKAIVSGFDGISVFFLGLLYIWPLIILLIIAIVLFRRWIAKRHKK